MGAPTRNVTGGCWWRHEKVYYCNQKLFLLIPPADGGIPHELEMQAPGRDTKRSFSQVLKYTFFTNVVPPQKKCMFFVKYMFFFPSHPPGQAALAADLIRPANVVFLHCLAALVTKQK